MDALSNIIWESLCKEADQSTKDERLLVAYLEETVIGQNSFEAALSYTLASKMRDDILPSITLRDLFLQRLG